MTDTSQIQGLVAQPHASVEELHAMLLAIDVWGRRDQDLRGVFAAAYVVVNRTLLVALCDRTFDDPAWVRAIVVDFGERYRLALQAQLDGSPTLICWAIALARSRGDGIIALRSLLLGMVAHIHHDLALSLTAHGPLDAPRLDDYRRIGDLLTHATPEIQREVIAGYAPELAGLHESLRGVDTRLTASLVRSWRTRASTIAGRIVADPTHARRWSLRLRAESAALALVVLPTSTVAGTVLGLVARDPNMIATWRGGR